MLAVADDGEGMSSHVREHLFEPFFTTKPSGRGSGLGLATTYGVVTQAGGSIAVQSEPGRGTTFRIYLPRVELPSEELGRVSETEIFPRGSETVLLVEDDAVVRDVASRILVRIGYTVFPAANGGEALALAEKHASRIDLLLTDVIMPEMNGRQLAERLVQLHPETKVLFTSGYTDDVLAHHGVLNGALSFIAKPYSPSALATKVREVLDADARVRAQTG
jgi:CheY-like chemotaxis protein